MRKILFNEEARNKLKKGIAKLCDAVEVTLGPKGRNAVYFDQYGVPQITKDGIAVASQIDDLGCEFENLGVNIIRQAAAKTADKAGDGTTTTTILATNMYELGLDYIESNVTQTDLKREMEKTKDDIIKRLDEVSQPCNSLDKIKHVANISANNDEFLGSLISEAIDKAGNEGVITIEDSPNEKTFLEVTDGMQFDKGYMSSYFCNEKNTAKLNNPLILITDKKITNNTEIVNILAEVAKQGKSLLIIANDVEKEVIAGVAMANKQGQIKACIVKSPGLGDIRRETLLDICAFTGAELISEELNLSLNDVTISQLGSAKQVTVTKGSTTIVEGKGADEDIDSRIETIKTDMEKAESKYQTEKLNERLAKLAGTIVVIRVGAITDVELIEKKARIEDSLNATKIAIDGGIIPGGGVALAQIANELQGCSVVLAACRAPLTQILFNAGEYKWESRTLASDFGIGYNVITREKGNLIDLGVIDPVEVTKEALTNAVSIASMLLTTEVAITEDK